MPGSTTDLAIPYALPADPRAEWPATNLSMSERIEALIRGAEAVVVAPNTGLAGVGTVADPLKVLTSGTWGSATPYWDNLSSTIYGIVPDDVGQPVYADVPGGLLRSRPVVMHMDDTTPKLGTDLPDTYPLGMSVLTLPSPQCTIANGWPYEPASAIVQTARRYDADLPAGVSATCQQWWYNNNINDPRAYYRVGQLGGWSSWRLVVSDSGWVDIAISAGFAMQGTEKPQVRNLNGAICTKGGWAPTGMTTAGSYDVGTIPVGYRPFQTLQAQMGTGQANVSAIAAIQKSGVIQMRVKNPFGTYYMFGGQSWPADA